MINIDSTLFYDKNTAPPPKDESINDYKIISEFRKPTLYSYLYLGCKENEKENKALKFIKYTKDTIEMIKNEIGTLSIIDHPNILKMEEYFMYKEYACIVTPYYQLQSLHKFIVENYSKGIPEKMACIIMHQILEALDYLHKKGIWHRDIKPDNILVADNDQKHPKVILADFGYAKKFDIDSFSRETLGSYEFLAPEIYKNEFYTNKVDIWSLGVSLFVILTGKYPTCSYSRNPKRCVYLIINGILNYKLLSDIGISTDAIDLIKKMCNIDPDLRITAEEALKHPWITKNINANNSEIGDVLSESGNIEFNIGN